MVQATTLPVLVVVLCFFVFIGDDTTDEGTSSSSVTMRSQKTKLVQLLLAHTLLMLYNQMHLVWLLLPSIPQLPKP